MRSWGDNSSCTAANSAVDTVAGLPLLPARCFFVFRYLFFAALPHIATVPLNFGGDPSRSSFTSSANTSNFMMGRNNAFLAEAIFCIHFCRKRSIVLFACHPTTCSMSYSVGHSKQSRKKKATGTKETYAQGRLIATLSIRSAMLYLQYSIYFFYLLVIQMRFVSFN